MRRQPQGFSDALFVPGPQRPHVMLASAPNTDDSLYRVSFEQGWEEALGGLERKGVGARIAQNIDDLSKALREDIEAGVKALPFRIEGAVFCQAMAQDGAAHTPHLQIENRIVIDNSASGVEDWTAMD